MRTSMVPLFPGPEALAPRRQTPDNYYVWDSPQFSDAEIARILQLADAQPLQTSVVGDRVDRSYRSSEIAWLPDTEETRWIYDRLASLALVANRECWQLDVVGFGEKLQVARYSSSTGGYYDWHMDTGEASAHRKISVSVQLSDPQDYEGGELQLQTGRHARVTTKTKGSVVMFPSYLLHRVTPVTAGCRRSMVIWISGPPLR